jgi:hypothetical protein
MNDYVSTRWVRVAALVASVMILWIVYAPGAVPWTAAFAMSLAFAMAFWLGRAPTRSVAEVIRQVDAERPARRTP